MNFDYELSKARIPVLKKCTITTYDAPAKDIRGIATIEVSDVSLEPVAEADLTIAITAPALVEDDFSTPKRKYFLRKDGSETPWSTDEAKRLHRELTDELQESAKK